MIEVTGSDGEYEDVQHLFIYIDDVNEKPFFTDVHLLGNILESITTSRVVVSLDATDPEKAVLVYEIAASDPPGAPFTIDSYGNNEHNRIPARSVLKRII